MQEAVYEEENAEPAAETATWLGYDCDKIAAEAADIYNVQMTAEEVSKAPHQPANQTAPQELIMRSTLHSSLIAPLRLVSKAQPWKNHFRKVA